MDAFAYNGESSKQFSFHNSEAPAEQIPDTSRPQRDGKQHPFRPRRNPYGLSDERVEPRAFSRPGGLNPFERPDSLHYTNPFLFASPQEWEAYHHDHPGFEEKQAGKQPRQPARRDRDAAGKGKEVVQERPPGLMGPIRPERTSLFTYLPVTSPRGHDAAGKGKQVQERPPGLMGPIRPERTSLFTYLPVTSPRGHDAAGKGKQVQERPPGLMGPIRPERTSLWTYLPVTSPGGHDTFILYSRYTDLRQYVPGLGIPSAASSVTESDSVEDLDGRREEPPAPESSADSEADSHTDILYEPDRNVRQYFLGSGSSSSASSATDSDSSEDSDRTRDETRTPESSADGEAGPRALRLLSWFLMIITCVAASLFLIYREAKMEAGFCKEGHRWNGRQSTNLFNLACHECPEEAYCPGDDTVECVDGYELQYHPLSVGGFLPMYPPTCELIPAYFYRKQRPDVLPVIKTVGVWNDWEDLPPWTEGGPSVLQETIPEEHKAPYQDEVEDKAQKPGWEPTSQQEGEFDPYVWDDEMGIEYSKQMRRLQLDGEHQLLGMQVEALVWRYAPHRHLFVDHARENMEDLQILERRGNEVADVTEEVLQAFSENDGFKQDMQQLITDFQSRTKYLLN
ncbi:hypothetical protein F4778DRAFT_783064 [Xylariomycetidae sp. FL2044]|nr:hypothetical protein F4778DRAFT_783064 [Xylariomycetidae sp. FL2044]